ncbi:histidinol-phosphate transaminase [Sinanaerobacter chloroacetimidivorans]|uniref:Histidinol-phosphate aminotransferase n=1 Tax=Sinanaerobacter chloroacetimidivorans TaxID=2818044 RepID=A0A8J7W3A1_9FIRM|nr:histidinol-phosphate transaminase [Sinanaerobacter chloroacetimidivorans]MBR0598306.1 histidinol-phosphate transaminase [Sinanaerobacter chloroacetimidivorans]
MSKNIFRKQLATFKSYVPGKPIEEVKREYGLDEIQKLASNENQFGPSPLAIEAIREEIDKINFYPEATAVDLVKDLASYLNVKPENVVVGNGGEGLIWVIAMTFLNEGDEILAADPSFDIYKISGDLMGAKTIKIPFVHKKFDFKSFVSNITENTKLIYVCSPNNPTGNIASKEEMDYLLANIPDDVVLILDEAYYEFAEEFDEYPSENIKLIASRPNTIILRSFSKIYGIAGVRLGYVVTSEALAAEMNKVRQTLGVNRLAQVGARAALKDEAYKKYAVEENRKAIDALEGYFASKGFDYFKSYSNFVWANINTHSKAVFEELQKRGIIIRPGFLWGWDNWIRVNTGTDRQMKLFIEKLEEVLNN